MRIPGKGKGVLQNFQKFRYGYIKGAGLPDVSSIVARAYRTNRSSERVQRRTPGIEARGRRNSQKFRVRYECPTELTEVRVLV